MNGTEIEMKKNGIFNFQLEIMVRKALMLCTYFMNTNSEYKALEAPKRNVEK